MTATSAPVIHLRDTCDHPHQEAFIACTKKRIIACAGRRSGKTTGIATRHVEKFLTGRRVLYGAPTQDQIERYWLEVTRALEEPIARGLFKKNESTHSIEKVGTEQRIKATTMWNMNTARGDYGDEVCLDEFEMMDEKVWTRVIAPMMLDHDGTTVFIYTPPDAESMSMSKARDPMYAAKLFQNAQKDTTGRWATFHFTSYDNPHLSKVALSEITLDMDERSIRQEILAEDIFETPGAIWTQASITEERLEQGKRFYEVIVVFMDPAESSNKRSDEWGISVCGLDQDGRGIVIADLSQPGPPDQCAEVAINAVKEYASKCNSISLCAESNAGGEMIITTVNPIATQMKVPQAIMGKDNLIPSVRSKRIRALPIRSRWGRHECGIVGIHERLEYQMCNWKEGMKSPDRMDAAVGALRKLMLPEDTDEHGIVVYDDRQEISPY
jgi:hypothetical protein